MSMYNMFQCGVPNPCVPAVALCEDRSRNRTATQLTIEFDPIASSRSVVAVNTLVEDADEYAAVEETKTIDVLDMSLDRVPEETAEESTRIEKGPHEASPRTLQRQYAEELRQDQDNRDVKDQLRRMLKLDDDDVDERQNPSPSPTILDRNDSLLSTTSSVKFLRAHVEDIDLDFVEEYDNAFNEFLSRYPKFLMTNPDLVHHVRIIKLQKMLEEEEAQEALVQMDLKEAVQQKMDMESGWHEQLRDAARKKAARETHLQSYLGSVHYNTKCMEGQLTWHVICDVERRAKKELALQRQLAKARQEPFDDVDLMMLLPEGSDFDNVRDSMLAPPGDNLSLEQQKDVRQFQMDNAVLAGELAAMKKKVAYLKATSKKNAWVESVLQRIDEKSLQRLKHRFRKRCGVPL